MGDSPDGSFIWPYQYPPYDIQVSFMRALNETLTKGNCGIFESPTGTGKTSSIICSVIPWLRKNWIKRPSDQTKSANVPVWVLEHENEKQNSKLERIQFLRTRRDNRYVERSKDGRLGLRETGKRQKRVIAYSENRSDDEASDDDDEEKNERAEEVSEVAECRKLYFCSRTHTQLSQFLAELKRVYPNREVTATTLGSRSQLCVNDEIRRKVTGEKLNDACLDLQDSSSSKKCEYLRNPDAVVHLADSQLYEIRDVEDLVSTAKSHDGCAYYAAREAAKSATIIALPYAALLSQNTREALGIDLEDNIIVCDEAHNLIDAVAEVHTCQVTLSQLDNALSEIKAYMGKYATRFNLDNTAFLAELASVVTKLSRYLNKSTSAGVLVLDEFIRDSRLEDNNIFELVKKAKDAQLNKKLKGVAKEMNRENTTILPVVSFIEALKSSSDDGRVSVTPAQTLKFLLLNPGAEFAKIVEKAHSVILTGGTMHPIDDVIEQLFTTKSGSKRQVDVFSCGHVIARENLKVLQVGVGPSKTELKVTFETRENTSLLDEIGNCIRNICNVCPDGVVVFLPSYSFQDSLVKRWEATGFINTLKKSLVKETRRTEQKHQENGLDETTFAEYERLLNENGHGCMLLAVVGGKLSEGINFCDHLARCVVMVGMPYPNKHESELSARMAFVDEHFGNGAGTRFFENKCWKAVNQSVGRSIRHKNDFASVVFLDVRYGQSQEKLPKWIADRFERCADWGQLMTGLVSFFRTKPKRIGSVGK